MRPDAEGGGGGGDMIPVNPGESEFAEFAAGAARAGMTMIPLALRIAADDLSAWRAFCELERDSDHAFLLESADKGEGGRHSFLGAHPRRVMTLEGGAFRVLDGDGRTLSEARCADPLDSLRAEMRKMRGPRSPDLPPFIGGAVGYMGYDCAHYFEPTIGRMKRDEIGAPDMLWMLADRVLAFDHWRRELWLIKHCDAGECGGDWKSAFRRGRDELGEWLARIQKPPAPLPLPAPGLKESAEDPPPPQSNFSRDEYCALVEQAKALIRAGDIFQVVPSQRFYLRLCASPLEFYRALRRVNPSPYMFCLKFGKFAAAGASPELMVRCAGGRVLVRPIAGTRPRGRTAAEDAKMESELRADEKEIAEHMMLVDLGRNDLGRVARPGSVRVPPERFCAVERYSHVMHMVSDAEGILADGCDAYDAARAAFPAGTLSGAPKVRAMQVINELESCKRGIYGGLAGHAGFSGDLATCIVIRTLVARRDSSGAGWDAFAQAGGGVVADSDPGKEWQESVNKAMAVLKAAHLSGATAMKKGRAEK